jgi:hypothetical protein
VRMFSDGMHVSYVSAGVAGARSPAGIHESWDEYASEWKAIESVANQVGEGSTETIRKWIRKAEVDAGQRPG